MVALLLVVAIDTKLVLKTQMYLVSRRCLLREKNYGNMAVLLQWKMHCAIHHDMDDY